MKTHPIPPGTYSLDSPEVARLLNLTPEKQHRLCEATDRSFTAAVRRELHSYVFDGAGI